MKTFIILFAVLVTLTSAVPQFKQEPQNHDRGCIYFRGKCFEECPEGTHIYNSNPTGLWHWEPNCDDPEPMLVLLPIAGYSACYCDKPTVRDPVSKKCVTVNKCPKKG